MDENEIKTFDESDKIKSLTDLIMPFAVNNDENESKYYKPLIYSSLLNFKVYPNTLDWLAHTYYHRKTIPSFESIGVQI